MPTRPIDATKLDPPPGYGRKWRPSEPDCPTILRYPAGIAGDYSTTPYVRFSIFDRETVPSGIMSATVEAVKFSVVDTPPTPAVAICLPIPTSALRTSHKIDFEALDLEEVGMVSAAIVRNADAMGGPNFNFANPIERIKLQLETATVADASRTRATYGAMGILGSAGDHLRGVVRSYNKFAFNPFTEILFKGVDFRTHDFEYTFLPKSFQDSEQIHEIIRVFQWYMHPRRRGPQNVALGSPNEWEIAYSIQNTTFGLLPSVIVNMDLDYGGGLDSPRFFNSPIDLDSQKQYPTKIILSIRFKEVVILTRDTLLEGLNITRTDNQSSYYVV